MATKIRFELIALVFVGDTITADDQVIEFDSDRDWVRIQGVCRNTDGEDVL